MFCRHLLVLTRFVMLLRRRSRSGAAERREGVRRGPSKNVRPIINQVYKARWCPEFLSALFFSLFRSDQLPEQRDCGLAAEERGPKDQAEEARAG